MSFRRVIALSLLIAAGVAQAQAPASEAPPAASPAAAEAAAAPASGAILGDAKSGEGKATACGACSDQQRQRKNSPKAHTLTPEPWGKSRLRRRGNAVWRAVG